MSTYPNYHDGRRALVTGAASGIGREAAIKFAEARPMPEAAPDTSARRPSWWFG